MNCPNSIKGAPTIKHVGVHADLDRQIKWTVQMFYMLQHNSYFLLVILRLLRSLIEQGWACMNLVNYRHAKYIL